MASQYTFEAIGTTWLIDIYEEIGAARGSVLLRDIHDRIAQFDSVYSRFRSDSLVTAMAQKKGAYTMPPDAMVMVSLYRDLYRATDGYFTPLIGQVLVDAGYDPEYSLVQKRDLLTPPLWEQVMVFDDPVLTIKEPVLLDFGAAGKGYLVDIVSKVIESHGISSYCVDAGGDIRHRHNAPLRVGLEHPTDEMKVIGVVEIHNQSICGSAGNRRTWQDFHHIIDPKRLSSPRTILAVWVIAETTIVADALATCLFFVPAATLEKYAFEYLLVRDDFSIEKSDGFVCDLY